LAHALARVTDPIGRRPPALLLIDRRGYGRSQPCRQPWSLRFLSEEARVWLPAVLDAAGVQRASFWGHSDGATIALEFAAIAPQRVDRVVAEAPHTVLEERTLEAIRTLVLRHPHDARLRAALTEQHGDGADTLVAAWSRCWLDPAFAGCDLRAVLPRVGAPCLVVQGGADPFGSRIHMRTVAALAAGPVHQLWLPSAGHAPHRRPQSWLTMAATFLAQRTSV
jgi:pimeloyl-ACP methyl ester carboxylesterase